MSPDPNATGAPTPLPHQTPGSPGRETHERAAAHRRGEDRPSPLVLCAPDVPGLPTELLFTLIAENVRDYAIFLLDADGIIRCWGEGARLMKWWTRSQAEGSHLRLMYPDGGSEDGTAESHLLAAAERGEYSGEGHRVRSDGSTFWAYVTLTALRNPEGTLVGFSKVTRDFTARRAVEASLLERAATIEPSRLGEETSRLKRFIADVSHEIRNPVNALLAAVALLEREEHDDAARRGHVERIRRTSGHLLEIVGDVLDMSRLDAGTLPVSRDVARLGRAITEALADVEPQLAGRDLSLIDAVSGTVVDLPYVGDELRVRQIVVNLLTNAIKFTGHGGQVTLSGGTAERVADAELAGTGPWIYVRVEDTGRGIPPEALARIFEPYQQWQDGDERRGAGLGLAISREFARAMGGDLTVRSEVGVGSTFTLWLPIAPASPVPR